MKRLRLKPMLVTLAILLVLAASIYYGRSVPPPALNTPAGVVGDPGAALQFVSPARCGPQFAALKSGHVGDRFTFPQLPFAKGMISWRSGRDFAREVRIALNELDHSG